MSKPHENVGPRSVSRTLAGKFDETLGRTSGLEFRKSGFWFYLSRRSPTRLPEQGLSEAQFLENLDRILSTPFLASVALCGSRGIGTGRPDSDYDLLVVSNGVSRQREIRRILNPLVRDYPATIHVAPKGTLLWMISGGDPFLVNMVRSMRVLKDEGGTLGTAKRIVEENVVKKRAGKEVTDRLGRHMSAYKRSATFHLFDHIETACWGATSYGYLCLLERNQYPPPLSSLPSALAKVGWNPARVRALRFVIGAARAMKRNPTGAWRFDLGKYHRALGRVMR